MHLGTLQTYIKVTLDHLNNTIGNGDERCFVAPGPEHEIECPEGYNFCFSEMEVDWLAKGNIF